MDIPDLDYMNLSVDSNNARALALQAIQQAKAGNQEAAERFLADSYAELSIAEQQSHEISDCEIFQHDDSVSLTILRAEADYRSAMLTLELAREIIDVYKILLPGE